MELYEEILLHLLSKQKAHIEVTFPQLNFRAAELVDSAAYCALAQIQHILKDDALSDADCFCKIEAIVREFERLDSDCGNRHDFG